MPNNRGNKVALSKKETGTINRFIRIAAGNREAFEGPEDYVTRTPSGFLAALGKRTRDLSAPYRQEGGNLAHLAAEEADVEVLKIIMKQGAAGKKALSQKDNNGKTPLDLARQAVLPGGYRRVSREKHTATYNELKKYDRLQKGITKLAKGNGAKEYTRGATTELLAKATTKDGNPLLKGGVEGVSAEVAKFLTRSEGAKVAQTSKQSASTARTLQNRQYRVNAQARNKAVAGRHARTIQNAWRNSQEKGQSTGASR